MSSRLRILGHVIRPAEGDLSGELARYLLSLDFPASDHARFAELSDRAQQGILSPEERAELEEYLEVNDFLTIVQSKARTSLSSSSAA